MNNYEFEMYMKIVFEIFVVWKVV